MNTGQTQPEGITPPKLIPTFVSGFDTVANKISLILLPLVLDLILWFGPRLSLKNLLQPMINEVTLLPGLNSPDMADFVRLYQQNWRFIAENFNLAILLRTYPVGVPSIMATLAPPGTPLGVPTSIELPSVLITLLLWLVIIGVGMIGGSIYFSQVAHAVAHHQDGENLQSLVWAFLQVIALTIFMIFIFIIIGVPTLMILPIILLISPGFAQIALFLVLLILAWMLVPLVFSPHGIFLYRQNALTSILTSARLVRFLLPGSLVFFLALFLLSQGLDLLWNAPSPSSWMALVGIAGHAFVTTSLMATSFVYYRDAMRWVQEVIQRKASTQKLS